MRKNTILLTALLCIIHCLPFSVLADEKTEVEVVETVEELAKTSSASDVQPFFQIDLVDGEVNGDAEFSDLVGEDYFDVVDETDSIEVREEIVNECLSETGLYQTGEVTDNSLDVVSTYAYKRIRLEAPQSDMIQTFGATQAVYFNDYYLLSYASEEETRSAYEKLMEEYGEYNVYLDLPIRGEAFGWGYDVMNFDAGIEKASASGEVVKIAVIDSGINKNHIIFNQTVIIDEFNAKNGEYDATDDLGHGTAVAGIIAESTPTNVEVIPIKVLGSDNHCSWEELWMGLQYAESVGADIVNMSISGNILEDFNGIREEAKKYYDNYNKKTNQFYSGLMVAASGNDSKDIMENYIVPAAVDNVITVGALNRQNDLSYFSNYGEGIDFVAPGESLSLADYSRNDGLCWMQGTSFASPYIAAVAANILATNPYYTHEDVYNTMVELSKDLGDAGFDYMYGYGMPVFTENGEDTDGIKHSIANASISNISDQTYSPFGIRPYFTISMNNKRLNENTDYLVTYKNNINAGVATITITGIGKYNGQITKTYKINPSSFPNYLDVILDKETYTYNGAPVKPKVISVKQAGYGILPPFEENKDFVIKYENNTKAGVGRIVFTGKGNWKGTFTKEFTITKGNPKWMKDSKGWWYSYGDGNYPKNKWGKISGSWYHFDKNGYMQTGWLKDSGKWYYLKSSGVMATGWVKVGSKYYYMDKSGVMQANKWIGNYYVQSDGSMAVNKWIGKYHVDASGKWDKTK